MTAKNNFVEPECKVGGTNCPMWDEWITKCMDADPEHHEEDRDPININVPFDIAKCKKLDTCTLAQKSCDDYAITKIKQK